LIAAIGLASSACVGAGLGGDSNEPTDGGATLDGEAGDVGGGDGRIVAIGERPGPAHVDGGAVGDAGAPGDGDGDGDTAPACDCAGESPPERDADGEALPYCAADGVGLVEADGHACDDAGACVPTTATRACGVECIPGIYLLATPARCRN
jgi:hypothetical protein